MNIRKFILIFTCFTMLGCATLKDLGSSNRSHILILSEGMTKDRVVSIMGTKTRNINITVEDAYIDGFIVHNPYRTEMLKGGGRALEVFYYYTNRGRPDYPITDEELTPVVFENDTLIGWGWDFLKDNVERSSLKPYPIDERPPVIREVGECETKI